MILETIEQPKMMEVYVKQAWHMLFCYGMAYEEDERGSNRMLLAIVSGSDSAIQSARAVADIGVRGGIRFGYGTKGIRDYEFTREYLLDSEKGKYEKFPMTLSNSRKALVLAHEELRTRYILSFDENPAHDIAQVLGAAPYGLHICKEWEDVVYSELVRKGLITQVDLYYDTSLFDGVHLFKNNMTEEDADQFISQLVTEGKIQFTQEGDGRAIEHIDNLTMYLQDFNSVHIEKVSQSNKPTYDASVDPVFERFEQYPRPLFPVQAHNATAIAKRLKHLNKSTILQGEMRCDTFTTEKVVLINS